MRRERCTDGVKAGNSFIPLNPCLRTTTVAIVVDLFILRPHFFGSSAPGALFSFLLVGLCHGFCEYIVSLKEMTEQRALLSRSSVLLDLRDSTLVRVRSFVRELLRHSCRSSVVEMTSALTGRELANQKTSITELIQGGSKVFSFFLGVGPLERALKPLDSPTFQAGKAHVVSSAQRAIASLDWGLPLFHLVRELESVCAASPGKLPMLEVLCDSLVGIIAASSVEEKVGISHFKKIRRSLVRSGIFNADGTNVAPREVCTPPTLRCIEPSKPRYRPKATLTFFLGLERGRP